MTPNQRVLLAKWLSFLAVLCLLLYASSPWPARAGTVDPADLVPTGGVIRWEDGRWGVHDAGHATYGLGAVTCDRRGILRVRIALASTGVGFGAVTPDETLAGLGITGGASVTRSEVRIVAYRHGRRLSCASPLFHGRLANWWLLWMVPVEAA